MDISRILKAFVLNLSRLSLAFFKHIHFVITQFFKFPARREASAWPLIINGAAYT